MDPEAWFAHYEANGWHVGRNPMSDWKAAVRTWEQNGNVAIGGRPSPRAGLNARGGMTPEGAMALVQTMQGKGKP